MATKLGRIIADFQTQLATAIAVGATSATLQKATDDDGTALPAGRYFFTIDKENLQKEHFSCALNGTALTSLYSISRQGAETSGAVRSHRIGASVIITDFAHIRFISDLLDGTTPLNASTPLIYDADPVISDNKHLATKKYIDDLATAGAPKASATALGISKLSVAPVDAAVPIAVGDNDTRVPTANQKAALAGTGTPSASNKFVTENDANLTNNVKTTGDQTVAGVKTFSSIPILPASNPTTDNQAVRKKYIDDLSAITTGSVAAGGGNTLTWSKRGKLYFNFKININTKELLYSDANTQNKIAALIGITISSCVNFSGSFATQSYWDGANWSARSSWDTSFINAILST